MGVVVGWVTRLGRDVRLTVRSFRRQPAFWLAAVCALSLGIGANAAIFSFAYPLVIRRLSLPDPASLVQLSTRHLNPPRESRFLAIPTVQDIAEQSDSFQSLAYYVNATVVWQEGGSPDVFDGALVSGRFFEVYAVPPLVGTVISPADTDEDHRDVVVLSNDLWRSKFSGRPDVVGAVLQLAVRPGVAFGPGILSPKPYTVIGVMPDRGRFPVDGDLWIPLPKSTGASTMAAISPRANRLASVVARLKRDRTVHEANERLRIIATRLANDHPETDKDWDLLATDLTEATVGGFRIEAILLLATATGVLILACIGVSSLLVARNQNRRQETAIRQVLGASRGMLAQQRFVESLALASVGGIGGVALARICIVLLKRLAPVNLPRLDEIGVDWPVVIWAWTVTVLVGVLIGMFPALVTTSHQLTGGLKRSISESAFLPRFRARGLIIGLQIALSYPILVGALLSLRSIYRLTNVDQGFDGTDVTAMTVRLSSDSCKTLSACGQAIGQMAASAAAVPGVTNASITSHRPFSVPLAMPVFLERIPGQSAGQPIASQFQMITPGFFTTLGIKLREGRLFDERDSNESPLVAIVNESLARLGPTTPLEEVIDLTPAGRRSSLSVVGVVPDIRDVNLSRPAVPTFYVPMAQTSIMGATTLLVRAAGPSPSWLPAVREAITRIDRNAPVSDVRPIREIVAGTVGNQRFQAGILAAFATLAVLLSMVSTYGLITFALGRRRKEFAVRLAMGARRGSLIWLVMAESLAALVWGLSLGAIGALLLTSYLRSILYELTPTDPVSFGAVAIATVGVSLLAYYGPAARMCKVTSFLMLREE